MVIPKPLCGCWVCREARKKGGPYARTGPSAFLHDAHLLIDTPAEIAWQLNRSKIERIDSLLFTHLDPDHIEGFRVVEQITLDFRSWRAYEGKGLRLILPGPLQERIGGIRSVYGPLIDYYEDRGFVSRLTFEDTILSGDLRITALPVKRNDHHAFIYTFEKDGKRMVYAPCDIKPFPEGEECVQNADLLVIQPGIFEKGLKHAFTYPEHHVSRTTLYTFEETLALSERIGAERVLFVHIEEYWNRSYEDYLALEKEVPNIRFAYDGLRVSI